MRERVQPRSSAGRARFMHNPCTLQTRAQSMRFVKCRYFAKYKLCNAIAATLHSTSRSMYARAERSRRDAISPTPLPSQPLKGAVLLLEPPVARAWAGACLARHLR